MIAPLYRGDEIVAWLFWCPGCNATHSFNVDPDRTDRWTFNGNRKKPTFSPSLLVQFHQEGADAPGALGGRCHLFLTDGMLHYLNDCSHDATLALWDPVASLGYRFEHRGPPSRPFLRGAILPGGMGGV